MKVVSLSSRKGGAGKSTICVHLAVAAEAAGLAVAIFDLDPQASAALWSDHRGEPAPAVVPAQAPRLRGLLNQAVERGADLVLLDTPPHADGVSADAGAVADVILIPCRPSAFDLDAIGASVKLAQVSKKPCFVIINAAPVQGTEVAETRAALEAAGVDVAPVVVHQRKAYSARAHEGRTAVEFEPGGKAANEIEALLAWLCATIELPRNAAPEVVRSLGTKVLSNRTTVVAGVRPTAVAGKLGPQGLVDPGPAVAADRGAVAARSSCPASLEPRATRAPGKHGSKGARR